MTEIDRNGQTAEGLVAAELRTDGREVLNLNQDIAGHYPLVDLITRRGGERMLIQVRGTGTDHGSFTVLPEQARRAETLGAWLGLPVLYALVHVVDEVPVIRYDRASRVAGLAEDAEANYPGTNRYHVDISQFDIDVHRLPELLDPPD